ncbi:microfibril-associated glycoprotein 4-like [Oscarella lobularis]|uniref:microfibril-associated glycoprotein 4-like n=1 Tax=Oscarella lobularis TaxID=121494 RepID=UPI003313BF0F
MVQLSIFFCFCLATAGWVASEPIARRESASDCNNSTADGVSVTVNVNSHSGSRCSDATEPIGCCADMKSRLTVIEQILQRILQNTNEATPSATAAPERDPLRTCKETLDQGFDESGVYTIDPGDGHGPFEVYCDMETDGGGWTVFQRREDGSVDFYRNWVDYKNGFGDLNKEFWLGLDKISRLTKESPQTLRIDMSDFDGNSRYAEYRTFEVGNEASGYVLDVVSYSGNAGDSFSQQRGMKFSTRDKDQDTWGKSCSFEYKGAWWYTSCHNSNLNGFYYKGVHKTPADGINWSSWKGYYYSLKFTEMKVRPK